MLIVTISFSIEKMYYLTLYMGIYGAWKEIFYLLIIDFLK